MRLFKRGCERSPAPAPASLTPSPTSSLPRELLLSAAQIHHGALQQAAGGRAARAGACQQKGVANPCLNLPFGENFFFSGHCPGRAFDWAMASSSLALHIISTLMTSNCPN